MRPLSSDIGVFMAPEARATAAVERSTLAQQAPGLAWASKANPCSRRRFRCPRGRAGAAPERNKRVDHLWTIGPSIASVKRGSDRDVSPLAKPLDRQDWALLWLLSLLWGGAFFFAGVAVKELPPLTCVLVRVALAAMTLLPIFFV